MISNELLLLINKEVTRQEYRRDLCSTLLDDCMSARADNNESDYKYYSDQYDNVVRDMKEAAKHMSVLLKTTENKADMILADLAKDSTYYKIYAEVAKDTASLEDRVSLYQWCESRLKHTILDQSGSYYIADFATVYSKAEICAVPRIERMSAHDLIGRISSGNLDTCTLPLKDYLERDADYLMAPVDIRIEYENELF